MILVDTSVWIDHLHRTEPELVAWLEAGEICTHPMVVGELALGSLADRDLVLGSLGAMPAVPTATAAEVLAFVARQHLVGIGLSLVDAHLLAGLRLAPGTRLWTRDRRLANAAQPLGVSIF